ncbi:hypothetical protein THIOM_002319 [Candidatus Thiomargarita nelsonii]|uniref:Uncharacterized protein n=1 Tax=Candidatus Thiomargarita nelsonii TaxID=1003181 RepID=A0A176S1G1_9GAMM|nr:hypothetical protein THIOM_002319 [Candidatus Thiomargarita nelsonii]
MALRWRVGTRNSRFLTAVCFRFYSLSPISCTHYRDKKRRSKIRKGQQGYHSPPRTAHT